MKFNVWLTLIIILGFLTRIYNIDKYGVWYDEQISILIANGQNHVELPTTFNNSKFSETNTLDGVLKSTISDNGNSIAYNVVLHFWLSLFGNSDFNARILSLIFSVISIIVAYKFSNAYFNNRSLSLLVALMFAVHPLLVHFGQETRVYSMALLFSFLSSYYFFHIVFEKASVYYYLLYSTTTFISLTSHYLSAPIFIAHLIIFVVYTRDKQIWIKYISSGILTLGLFSSWLFVGGLEGYVVLAGQNKEYISIVASGKSTFAQPATLQNIITGWFQIWLQIFGNRFQNWGFRVRELFVLLVIPFYLVVNLFSYVKLNFISSQKVVSLIIMVFTQTAFATFFAIKSGHTLSFQPSYAIFVIPYAIFLMGSSLYFCYQNNKKLAIGFGFFVLFTMVASLPIRYLNFNKILPSSNQYYKNAQIIKTTYNQHNEIVFKSSFDAKMTNLYFGNSIYQQRIDTSLNIVYLIK